ncbi:MAG: 16S rRNA (cytosine(1402)-N(4))-methyltransferase RsmH [Candidatus Methylacidiphilales bacterium]|nr:16S rRNA (cytosine(1402)-N(4))-methyltransferase RsmH [Candidatus Methylacidiphilales bacterium]
MSDPANAPIPHKRRVRYSGTHPRKFAEKYKELNPEKYPETVAKVVASGKTPAGSHLPILVDEVLLRLDPKPGEIMLDATLGYGGHAARILPRLVPGGCLIGVDVDPIEQPRTEARLREAGFGADVFQVERANYAGISRVLADRGLVGVDGILADLGVSSMQLDTPERVFSVKHHGPLDMRMNPQKGIPASEVLERMGPDELAAILREDADEPRATDLALRLAGRKYETTTALAAAIRITLGRVGEEEQNLTVRRFFQALRIRVNEELTALDAFLHQLPTCLKPGGRVVILSFHSGEDRRVKKALAEGLERGIYREIAANVIRPMPGECHLNPRAKPAKLRWAVKG